jgi:hypothetical protein
MKIITVLAFILSAAFAISNLKAASTAFDSAANPAYNTGWNNGPNDTGFSVWFLSNNGLNPADANQFIGSSTTNGLGDSSLGIDTNGRSWGLFAQTPQGQGFTTHSNADRLFGIGGASNSSALDVGQTFSIEMDNGLVQSGGSVGLVLSHSDVTNGLGNIHFELMAIGGQPDYMFNLGDENNFVNMTTTVPVTSDGVSIFFSTVSHIGTAYGYSFTITSHDGPSFTSTFSTNGVNADISHLDLFDSNGGSDPSQYVYFNSMAISDVPEPATWITAALIAGLLAFQCFVQRSYGLVHRTR